MKKFDFTQFSTQLTHSRLADNVIAKLGQLDRLVKFALQHCDNEDDYLSLYNHLLSIDAHFELFIKLNICNEHTENHESTTCTSENN